MTPDELRKIAERCGYEVTEFWLFDDGAAHITLENFRPHIDHAQAIECLDRVFKTPDGHSSYRIRRVGDSFYVTSKYPPTIVVGPTFPAAAMNAIKEVIDADA